MEDTLTQGYRHAHTHLNPEPFCSEETYTQTLV